GLEDQLSREHASRRALVVAVSVLLGAVVLALALGIWIAWLIARPWARLAEAIERVAAGDLTVEVPFGSSDEVGRAASGMRDLVEQLRQLLVQLAYSAAQVATGSEKMLWAAQGLAGGSQEQASSLEETAGSLEEVTSAVTNTADNAQQANELAVAAREVA